MEARHSSRWHEHERARIRRGRVATSASSSTTTPTSASLISRVLAKIGVNSLGLVERRSARRGAEGAAPRRSSSSMSRSIAPTPSTESASCARRASRRGPADQRQGHRELLNDIKAIGERNGLNMLDPLRKPFRSEHLRQIFDGGDWPRSLLAQPPTVEPAVRAARAARRSRSIDLDEALDAHWLDMHYQPKVDLAAQLRRRGGGSGPRQSSGSRHPRPGIVPSGRVERRRSAG